MKLTNVIVLFNKYRLLILELLKVQRWPVVHDDKEIKQQRDLARLSRMYKKSK